MKRALFLFSLLLAGCSSPSSPPPSPQNPPNTNLSPSAVIETSAQVNAEIKRRYPQLGTIVQMTQVAIDILDNAQAEKTAWAVKDWANDNYTMLEGLSKSFKKAPNAKDTAGMNCSKWMIAAADAKAAQLRNETSATDYETAKKNALAEAARDDSLPIQ